MRMRSSGRSIMTTRFQILIGVVILLVTTSEAQSGTPACVSNLVPCANFMSSTTKPPQSCCGPLKTAVTTQLDCLCGLYNTPGLLQSFNVNITQALKLPSLCGIDGASLSECSKVGGPAAPSPAGSSLAPKGNPDSGAGKIYSAGFGLFLAMATMRLLL